MAGLGGAAKHLLGLALAAALVWAGYWAWTELAGWIRQTPSRDLRVTLFDLRLPLEVMAAFLAASAADWGWRKLFPGS